MPMQPTFRIKLASQPEDAIARLREAMAQGDLGENAAAAGSCLDFRIATAERRLWSPHLSVQLMADQLNSMDNPMDKGSTLFGRFSPRPEVWTLVMVFYFAAVFVAIGAAIYGCVQAMLGESPWALLAIPVCAAGIVGLHLLSLAGQRLSADQMQQLRERLDRVVVQAFGE